MSRFERKGWDQLSPGYQRRLERGGVTQASYESGASLTSARGKSAASTYQHELDEWKARQRINYGRSASEINAALRGRTRADIQEMIRLQQAAEQQFNPQIKQKNRPRTKAHKTWKLRDKSFAEWMYYYHGLYS